MAEQAYQPRVPARSVRRSIRGIEYHCSEWGDAGDPLLVLLHGWGDSGSTFQFLVDALENNWRVVAPDWRGFGDSGHNLAGYWFPDYLADLDVLLEILSPESAVHLIGHSMGANVAALYAGIMPERVRSFVNIEGFGLAESDPAGAADNYRRWIEHSRQMPQFMHYGEFDELVPRILRRSSRLSVQNALFVARQWAREDADGLVRLKADPAHKLPSAVQYRRSEAEACWSRVLAPVLLVAGADTDFAFARDWIHGEPAALPFPDVRTVSIADAGHMVHFEQPEALAAAIEEFVLSVL